LAEAGEMAAAEFGAGEQEEASHASGLCDLPVTDDTPRFDEPAMDRFTRRSPTTSPPAWGHAIERAGLYAVRRESRPAIPGRRSEGRRGPVGELRPA
jgi:hypothetical protein